MTAPTALTAFLDDPARPAGTLRYHELQGFLFVIACAPELIRPSEWMPLVFGDEDAEYASLDQAKLVIGELMSLYNAVSAGAQEDPAALPPDCPFRDDLLSNLDDAAPVAQWSRGFMRGHQWLEELWDAYVPDELDEEFGAILLTLSFFASSEIAEAFQKEMAPDESLDAMATTIRRTFPDAVDGYARLGRTIARVLQEAAVEQGPQRTVKVGRNDPCPCGSGRKFKKCCGAKAH